MWIKIILACLIALTVQYLSDIIGFMGSSVIRIVTVSPFFISFCLSLLVALTAYILIRYGVLTIFKMKYSQLCVCWRAKALFNGIFWAIGIAGLSFLFSLLFAQDIICVYNSQTPISLWKSFWDVGISTGFAEELIFRGFLLVFLLKYMRLGYAVALSSIVFVFPHLFISSDFINFLSILITDMSLAILMAILYLKSRTLITSISFHATINFITFGLWNEVPSNTFPTTLFCTIFSNYTISPASIIFVSIVIIANIYLLTLNRKEQYIS